MIVAHHNIFKRVLQVLTSEWIYILKDKIKFISFNVILSFYCFQLNLVFQRISKLISSVLFKFYKTSQLLLNCICTLTGLSLAVQIADILFQGDQQDNNVLRDVKFTAYLLNTYRLEQPFPDFLCQSPPSTPDRVGTPPLPHTLKQKVTKKSVYSH